MLKERLLNYIKFKNINVYEVETKAGFGMGTIMRMKNGIRTDKFRDLLMAFPDVNPDYLLGLSDKMLRAEDELDLIMLEMSRMKEQIALYEKVIKKLSE